ncbi:MAG: hypothetical protein JWR44_1156 [Hymenobacter sp.]|nr:hypothetical protein [Hymenobacter sp.]
MSCPEGINVLPMYGNKPKCPEQIEADKEFLAACDQQFASRKLASEHHLSAGWRCTEKGEFDPAMKRFNQAWLLDSTNAEVYWGFANVLGMKKQFRASIPLFTKYLKMNAANADVWEGLGTSYGQMFFQIKDVALLNKSIDALKSCVRIDPRNARAYGRLAGAYSYFVQQDSARKYLALADRLDPQAVNPELRKRLTK